MANLELAIPSGPFQEPVLKALKQSGLEFDHKPRCYEIVVGNAPVTIQIQRPSSLLTFLEDPESDIQVVLSGTDILWEQRGDPNAGSPFPLYELNRKTPQPRLYVGVSSTFAEKIRDTYQRAPKIQDIAGQRVATKYPNIAQRVLLNEGVTTAKIITLPGTVEAYPYAYRRAGNALVDIISSGATVLANEIDILDLFHDVCMRIVANNEKLSAADRNVLSDVMEMVEVERLRRREI